LPDIALLSPFLVCFSEACAAARISCQQHHAPLTTAGAAGSAHTCGTALGWPMLYCSVAGLHVPQACSAWRSPKDDGMQYRSPEKRAPNGMLRGALQELFSQLRTLCEHGLG